MLNVCNGEFLLANYIISLLTSLSPLSDSILLWATSNTCSAVKLPIPSNDCNLFVDKSSFLKCIILVRPSMCVSWLQRKSITCNFLIPSIPCVNSLVNLHTFERTVNYRQFCDVVRWLLELHLRDLQLINLIQRLSTLNLHWFWIRSGVNKLIIASLLKSKEYAWNTYYKSIFNYH
jgi:hypothetical protein